MLSRVVANEAIRNGVSVTMINSGRRKTVEDAELIVCDCHKIDDVLTKLKSRRFDSVIDFLCYTEKSFEIYSKVA